MRARLVRVPLRVSIDLGYRPELKAPELLEIVRGELGDRYEVYDPGRWQVPDVMVKRSEDEGVAIQLLQRRLRRRTRLRVYGLRPSIARRGGTPVGLAAQERDTQPLLDEVVRALRGCERLRPGG